MSKTQKTKRTVKVRFGDYDKEYVYYANVELVKDAIYDIVADDNHTYSTPVKVVSVYSEPVGKGWRTITSATLVKGAPKPDDNIKRVILVPARGLTKIIWKDGSQTSVQCCAGDDFDAEKGVALCYMKKLGFNNRKCYNDVLRKYCHQEEE